MSESGATFADLRRSWKVWKVSEQAGDPKEIWNWEAIDLREHVRMDVNELGSFQEVLCALLRAVPDSRVRGGGHVYVPDPDEESRLRRLEHGGVVVQMPSGYQLLGMCC